MNVRIILLPDGEDPDSYSRNHGSTAFKEYLTEHSRDFISFKIDLFARDAGHDPIRKAEAIRDIVTSISLIPDAIKRSVYIQETSNLLRMPESVLVTELNKIVIGERKKREQDRAREETIVPAADIEAELAEKTDLEGIVQRQERESMRLLLNYAETHYDDQRLVDFMLSELDDVAFTNPVYNEIFQGFKEGAAAGKLVDTYYFMENGSPEVKQEVAELTTPRYETSRHWHEKYHIYFPNEKEIVHDLAYTNVLRLKFRLIQKLMEDNLLSMKQTTSEEDLERYFTIHEQLKAGEKELASLLGIVVTR
jgi:DNA primase